jgi:hypothetical protein
MTSHRQQALLRAVKTLAPGIPPKDAAAVVEHALASPGLKRGSPEAAAWLSLLAYVRHNFTDYDDLLAEGYGQEAARHFSLEAMNEVLGQWGCRRRVIGEDG